MSKINLRRRGFMLVLSSPSGGGKTTLAKMLLKKDKNLVVSLSVTTRDPRPNETDGKDYIFVDIQRYRSWRQQGLFLEHAKVFGHYYGTLREQVEKHIDAGVDVLFDIDWQGTIQLTQNARNDVVSVFILPPSLADLEERLVNRRTDSATLIQERMHRAKHEINHWYGYDYVVMNHTLQQCLQDITSILHAERTKRTRQHNLPLFIESLFSDNPNDES